MRCAIYTRKSTEERLDMRYNSLDAQRDACLAYIESQKHNGWVAVKLELDDGGYSGGSIDRPALRRLIL
jgi:site-specific DNA recombinase